MLIWILLADISFTYRLSGVMVFGIGWGMVTLGVLLGSSLGQFVCTFAPFSPQSLSLIALLATLAILISYMFVFNENDLIALAKGDETRAAPSRGASVSKTAARTWPGNTVCRRRKPRS